MKTVAVVVVIASTALGSYAGAKAWARPPTQLSADIVECHTFVLRDGSDRSRLQITCTHEWPVFQVLGEGGKVLCSLRLRMDDDKPMLEVLDSKESNAWNSLERSTPASASEPSEGDGK